MKLPSRQAPFDRRPLEWHQAPGSGLQCFVLALLVNAPTSAQEAQETREDPVAVQEDVQEEEATSAEQEPTSPPAETRERRFRFDGFGTLGLVHSSEDRADYFADLVRPDGPGFTHDWSADVDSRLGLQLTADVTRKLTAVVQVVVEQQFDDDIEPTLEWANLKYAVNENFSVRIGRIALPGFLASEYRKVGYAYPWVRPPVEFYGMAPLFNSDGIDATYHHHLAGWTNRIQANLGFTDFDLPGGTEVEISEIFGVHDTLERGFLTLRATHTMTRMSVDSVQPLFDAFRSFGPEGQVLGDRFDVDDKRLRFVSVGASYDPGRWFVIAELGRIRTRSFIGDRTAGHVTGGYRAGKLTAFAVYAESVADSPLSSPGLTLSTLPPPLRPPAAGLNAVLNDLLASLVDQRTVSLGARWDYHPHAALTVQLGRIDVGAGSIGSFRNRQPGFEPGGEATTFSISTSFVF